MINYPIKPIRRILCVDDDEDDANLIESAVSAVDKGIVFIKCFGGKEALDVLQKTNDIPDLAFLDVNMPLMNGFDLLLSIRKDSRFDTMPIIMLSTSASPKDINMALTLGALKFFTKPNSYKDLRSMMSGIILECLQER